MSTASIRTRQITYCVVILALFSGIAIYSPRLERIKQEKDLGEATIGQVDTGSFMLKLAMIGGARGIAANVLWSRAVELQRQQEWDKLKSTVDLITKLQPHFLAIWTFQGWNLAYNVSVEWDDPADKYVWIKNGILFLKEGVDNNPRSPDLTWDTAWTYYHKLGFSDEAIVLRRQFYDDDDDNFKTDPTDSNVYDDNFQVSRGWFTEAIEKASRFERIATDIEAPVEYVDPVANRKGRPGDLAFQAMPAHAATRYAQGLEKRSIQGVEARFGERASSAWGMALGEWNKFGAIEFPSHNLIDVGGQRVKQPIHLEDAVTPDQIMALGKDTAHWDRLIGKYNNMELPPVTPQEAEMLAENQLYWTDRWASQMNYRYWRDRCLAEMELEGVRARELFYEGTVAYLQANFREAVSRYREGLELWKQVLDRHPVYRDDTLNQQDTGQVVRRYADALRQAGEEVPTDFPFAELLAAAELESTPDPFDELDMLGPTGLESPAPREATPPPAENP